CPPLFGLLQWSAALQRSFLGKLIASIYITVDSIGFRAFLGLVDFFPHFAGTFNGFLLFSRGVEK
ncbi:MAG TPA: hypothetical protein VJI67_04130, partial [archaeon]|nr:hypothetical protein [archaeon]